MMKKEMLYEAIGDICDDYIASAHASPAAKRSMLLLRGTMAACLCVVVCGTVFAVAYMRERPNPIPPEITVGSDSTSVSTEPVGTEAPERPYRELDIIGQEVSIMWPWAYKTMAEKYTSLEIDGMAYSGRGYAVDASHIGQKLGAYTAIGYDDGGSTDERHEAMFDVYAIAHISPDRLVAVEMEERYYVFIADRYDMPATWGDVLREYGLAEAITYNRFRCIEPGKEDEYFVLSDDAYIWEILNACQSAPAVDPSGWYEKDRGYISFTVTSDMLGVYKQVLYVTEDGYVRTNIFRGAYLYDIGREAAGKIIAYAMENAERAEPVPYREMIVGNIVEITADYLLLDDSILCKDPQDGIVVKVLLNDLRISRYVDMQVIEVGDTVQITYETPIDLQHGVVIDSAISVGKAIIAESDVLIPE